MRQHCKTWHGVDGMHGMGGGWCGFTDEGCTMLSIQSNPLQSDTGGQLGQSVTQMETPIK